VAALAKKTRHVLSIIVCYLSAFRCTLEGNGNFSFVPKMTKEENNAKNINAK
jgi:hypothetical protein